MSTTQIKKNSLKQICHKFIHRILIFYTNSAYYIHNNRRVWTSLAIHNYYGAIGLYRDVWIAAIASSTTSLATRTAAICVRFQGRRVRRVYVTMHITFLTRKSALIYRLGLRQRVASLTLNCNGDFAKRAYRDPSDIVFTYDTCYRSHLTTRRICILNRV